MIFEPRDIDQEIRNLIDEGLKPTTIAALLKVTLQQVYEVLYEEEHYDTAELYDEDRM